MFFHFFPYQVVTTKTEQNSQEESAKDVAAFFE